MQIYSSSSLVKLQEKLGQEFRELVATVLVPLVKDDWLKTRSAFLLPAACIIFRQSGPLKEWLDELLDKFGPETDIRRQVLANLTTPTPS